MVFDPYAPPPEQPAYPPYPPPAPNPGSPPYPGYPPQYGWQPYPYAAPAQRNRNRSRDLLVGGGIALAGLAMLAFVWLVANSGPITSVFMDDSVTFDGGGGYVEIPADDHGPAFEIALPFEWHFVPMVPDRRYRAHLTTGTAQVAIGSAYAPEESLDAALDEAVRAVGEGGDRDDVPRLGYVAGHPALMVRLADGDATSDVWVVAFHGKGARWYARYSGPPQASPLVPVELTHVLEGWRW